MAGIHIPVIMFYAIFFSQEGRPTFDQELANRV